MGRAHAETVCEGLSHGRDHMLEQEKTEEKGAAEKVLWCTDCKPHSPCHHRERRKDLGMKEWSKPGKKAGEVNFLVLSLFRIILLHF